jgi:hypothetical protein
VPDAPLRPEPFAPRATPEALADLRARLRATRWPDAPEDAGWSLGTDVAYLRELADYWADGFDWPAQEAALARLPRYRVRLGGLGIHFVHVRAARPAGPVLPLVLSHGWPDSFAGVPVYLGDPAALTPEERAWMDAIAAWAAAEGAYSAMHRTKPQTAAAGLTGTIGSSMRMYHANAAIPPAQHARRVEVPSGFTLFPADITRPPRAWLERTANVVRVTEPDRGGHFAPVEEPGLYAEELREFFRPYRTR